MRKEWFVLLVQLILFPLAIYAAAVTRDRDTRQIQQWTTENFVSKADHEIYRRDHDKFGEQRTAVLEGKLDMLAIQIKSLAEGIAQTNRRLERLEDRLSRP